jgi:hypothetical protein
VSSQFSASIPIRPIAIEVDDLELSTSPSGLSHDHRKEILLYHQRERGQHVTKHDTLVCNQHNAFQVSRFDGAGNCDDMMIPDHVYNPLKEHFHSMLKDQRKGKRRSFGSTFKPKSKQAEQTGASPCADAPLFSDEGSIPVMLSVTEEVAVCSVGDAKMLTAIKTVEINELPSSPVLEPVSTPATAALPGETFVQSPLKPIVKSNKPKASPKKDPQPTQQSQKSRTLSTEKNPEVTTEKTPSNPLGIDFADLGCSSWQEIVDMVQTLRQENYVLKNQVGLLQTFAKSQVRRIDQLQERLQEGQ